MKFNDLGIKPIKKEKIENKLVIKIGDLADKYECSFGMIELALKKGINKELGNNKDCRLSEFRIAKEKALKNINKNLKYYDKKLK